MPYPSKADRMSREMVEILDRWRALAILILVCTCPGLLAKENSLLTLLNSDEVDYGGVQTEHGLFLTRKESRWGRPGKSRIVQIDATSDVVLTPHFAQADFDESDPAYDPRRDALCFISSRPMQVAGPENTTGDIWCSRFREGQWQTPYVLPPPVNSPEREFSPSFDADGILYFASDRPGGFGAGDIYRALERDDGSWDVENLGATINAASGEWNVGVDHSGRRMLVEASSRPSNRSVPGDLYYSEQRQGRWTPLVPLSLLNSDASDLMARWIDPSTILFASARTGNGDVDHYLAHEADWRPTPNLLSVVARSSGELVLLNPEDLSEVARYAVGTGPHESAASRDGRVALVPLLGIYPSPHKAPVDKRPPFLESLSAGVVVLDLATGVQKTLALRDCLRPHAVTSDAQGRRFWVSCELEGVVIELASDNWTETRRYPLKVGVHKLFYAPGEATLYASNPDTGEFARLDLSDGSVQTRYTGEGAEGFVLSPDGATAWLANSIDGTVCRIETTNMESVYCRDVGKHFPIALALIRERDELWVSRLQHSDLLIMSASTGEAVDRMLLPTGALDLEGDPRTGRVYASLPRHNRIVAIDSRRRRIVASYDDAMEADDIDLLR